MGCSEVLQPSCDCGGAAHVQKTVQRVRKSRVRSDMCRQIHVPGTVLPLEFLVCEIINVLVLNLF